MTGPSLTNSWSILTMTVDLCLVNANCLTTLVDQHLLGDALNHVITFKAEGTSQTNRILVCSLTKRSCENRFIQFEAHEELDVFFITDVAHKVLRGFG